MFFFLLLFCVSYELGWCLVMAIFTSFFFFLIMVVLSSAMSE